MRILLFFLLVIYVGVSAQEAITVIGLEGNARVQRSQERSWKKLEPGSKLYDNDLVETYFQTKLIMQFGTSNLAILGSNSKALLNITNSTRNKTPITEISVTLFNGGVFAKAITNCRVNIYTANAVGVMDSGSVTTVAEGKTGETGFQALGGTVLVRNIAQQKGIELRSGLTTMIQPGKEPTAPLYITYRHVAVLKHFFGEDYIVSELDASGIKPTDERGNGRSGSAAFSTRSRGYVDEGMYKSLFSLNRIYGSILDEKRAAALMYHPLRPELSPVEGRGMVSFASDIGFSSESVSARIVPSVSFLLGSVDAGARLSFVKTDSAGFTGGFSSLAGILDKVHHVSFGKKTGEWSVFAGTIENLTFGYGLVVDNFTNASYNNGFQPLGAIGRVRVNDELSVRAFTADCSAPLVNGVYVLYEPSTYHFGLGYAGDVNQYSPMVDAMNMRFVGMKQDGLYPDIDKEGFGVHCAILDFTAELANEPDIQIKMMVEFAKKLFGGNDGFIARMPAFQCDLRKMSFGAGVIVESGRLLSSQFDEMYLDRRFIIKTGQEISYEDSVITPNNRLAKNRQTFGGSIFYKINPYKGTDIDFYCKQDISSKNMIVDPTSDTGATINVTHDFNFRLRCAINDSLVRYIRYAELVFQQSHGRITSPGAFPFSSWTFNGHFSVVTVPLLFNIAIESGVDFFYFDTGKERNNKIDSEDRYFIARAGIHWGFR